MTAYELDDDLVRRLVAARSGLIPETASHELALALESQLPLPAPTKIGAVVRASQPNGFTAVYIRWADEEMNAASPWVQHGDYDRDCLDTDDLGRITEVLSEGVDL